MELLYLDYIFSPMMSFSPLLLIFSGYMSPEYAMLGQFSVKSDVFSFGVIMLEIVSGKRNVDYNGVNSIDDLVSHVSILLDYKFRLLLTTCI